MISNHIESLFHFLLWPLLFLFFRNLFILAFVVIVLNLYLVSNSEIELQTVRYHLIDYLTNDWENSLKILRCLATVQNLSNQRLRFFFEPLDLVSFNLGYQAVLKKESPGKSAWGKPLI
jgi:energy-converting hydrogenase Eha subunit H